MEPECDEVRWILAVAFQTMLLFVDVIRDGTSTAKRNKSVCTSIPVGGVTLIGG